MKTSITILTISLLSLAAFLTGCGQSPSPIREGVISEVRWNIPESGDTTYTLRRVDKADAGTREKGGVEMYGVLYPTFLEIRFGQGRNPHIQIIPTSQIVWLEFGDGGRAIDEK